MADAPASTSPHQIVHVEIPSADQQASCDFYGGLFGWETVMLPEMEYAGYNPGDERTGVGFAKIDAVYEPGKVVVHVSTPDIEATLAKATGLGATTLVPKTAIPGMGYYAIFTDPSGNRIGLYTGGE